MNSNNGISTGRVSNWTLATGTLPGHRPIATGAVATSQDRDRLAVIGRPSLEMRALSSATAGRW